jgi:pentatricopeptide repeat protein
MASPTKSSRLFSRWVSPLAEDNSSAQCSPETSPSTSGTPRPFGGVLQTPTIVTDSSPTESASTPIPSHDFITSFLTTTWYEGIVDKSAASTVAHRSPTPHSVTPSPPPPLRERTTTAVTPSHDCRFTYRGASPPTKPWSSFHTAESNTGEDELLVEVTRPWLHYADPPRPVSFTPRVTKPTQSPFKLEPLGPLRRHSNKVLPSKTYISETPRLPYAQVAGSDAPEMAEILALPPRTTVSKRNEKNYQNLIREAASSGNPGTAEAYLKSMMLDAASGLTPSPDGRCYNHVMHAYAQAGNPEDAQKIMDLMWENAMFSEGPLPNKKLYTNLLHAWQKSSDKYRAPEECENILRQMYRLHNSDKAPQCKPDIFTYTCILHCWADSKRSDAVRRADKLFDEMMLRYGNGETDLAPDRVCYSNLINVYINSQDNDFSDIGTIVKAEGRFWEMVDLFFAGNKKAEPSTRNFNTILAALSNCTSSKAALHASEMILKWEKLNQEGKLREEPDSYSYSLLLKSW